MKMKIWIVALCLSCLTLAGSPRLFAAGPSPATGEQELHAKMISQGWKPIAKGVYERQRGPNKFEHMGYGREGFAWMIGELTRQRNSLVQAYQSYPSEDLHKVIDQLAVKIAEVKRDLRNTKSLSSQSEKVAGASCSICYSATADGYPLSGSAGQGVGAIADASFSSNCGYSGDTYAYAFAQATLGGTTTTHTQSDGPYTGTSVTSHASATVNGSTNCSSNANSYATSTALGISYSTSDSNSLCPAPPPPSGPTVTISGPTSITKFTGLCKSGTWTASATGGTTPYTNYAWTLNGFGVGTNSSSLTLTFCPDDVETVTVGVTVTDYASHTGLNTFSTWVDVEGSTGCGGNPCQ